LSGAAFMLTAMRAPDLLMMNARRFMCGCPLTRAVSNRQFLAQMSARKISKQFWPTASAALNPVIFSAAGLR
jgi:hypothetical protein